MIEKDLQQHYIELLETLQIPYLHIPNRAFSKKYTTPKCLKYFADLFFLYNGVAYFREFGLIGRHLDRKAKQIERMKEFGRQGADVLIINNYDGMKKDWINIGLLVDSNLEDK